ncbi:MAG: protein-glutamate O-methyltransferase CheR [Lachnospiraceae bacterium]|nr:protein-glutamate O-methyltransferase CheR [Lachnospiraceae bacterium]
MENNYEQFKKDVLQLTKIDLNAYKERQMKRRIDALISKHQVSTYKEYVQLLRDNTERFDEFVNYLTINVSEFYRNPELWNVLDKEILPVILKNKKSPKIWSAACSTGDEPYSLVMALNQFLPFSQIHIIATDIDKQVLDKARMGLYNDKSLKGLPGGFLDKYFTKVNEHNYQINQEVKNCVEFKEHNLLKDPYPSACDMIVCRNVMIYFTEEAKEEIYKKFNAALVPEGFLFVGSTEQIIQPGDMGYKSFRSFFYRKE